MHKGAEEEVKAFGSGILTSVGTSDEFSEDESRSHSPIPVMTWRKGMSSEKNPVLGAVVADRRPDRERAGQQGKGAAVVQRDHGPLREANGEVLQPRLQVGNCLQYSKGMFKHFLIHGFYFSLAGSRRCPTVVATQCCRNSRTRR